MKKNQVLFVIISMGLLIHLITFPFFQKISADAVSRIFEAEYWLKYPHFITHGVWLPLHHYLNALVIWLTGDHKTWPALVHILLGVFTVIPVYRFAAREFSEKGAWFSAVLYLFSPVIFRYSGIPLSEIPFGFFIAWSINFLSRSIRENNARMAVFAGLFATISAGFRYEAWLLIPVFTCICLYHKKWKIGSIFILTASVFPVFWMVGNYIEYQNLFYGIAGNNNYLTKKEGVNENVTLVDKFTRILFFPTSWLVQFYPVVSIGVICLLIKKTIKKQWNFSRFIWTIPFLLLFAIDIYKAYSGTLGLQHRFTSSLMVVSVPFAAILFEKINWNLFKKVMVAIMVLSILPMSYVWMQIPVEKIFSFSYPLKMATINIRNIGINEVPAIPRLKDQDVSRVNKVISNHLNNNQGLILDFVSWESTYYFAFQSGLHPSQIFINEGARHGEPHLASLEHVLTNLPTGVIMLKKESNLRKYFNCGSDRVIFNLKNSYSLKLTYLDSYREAKLFKYQVVSPIPMESNDGNCLLD